MKYHFKLGKHIKPLFTAIMACGLLIGCEDDFLDIDPPTSEVVREKVFSNDATATAALNGIYSLMIQSGMYNADLEVFTGLASDEFINHRMDSESYIQFQQNELLPNNQDIFGGFWQLSYQLINNANGIIEGIQNSEAISIEVRNQIEGEALFIRAYVHFYLVNLFGDVPYVDTTNVESNNTAVRDLVDEIYGEIIEDLMKAETLMSEDFDFSGGERTRPNRYTAKALLARCYLYSEDWAKAEQKSSEVIDENGLFELEEDLNSVFGLETKEALWQLVPETEGRTRLGDAFILNFFPPGIFSTSAATSMTDELVATFEPGDQRSIDWVRLFTLGSDSWYHPYKYKNGILVFPPADPEYAVVFRLAEQYLIRAEARAQIGDLSGAQADINAIRGRALLPNTLASTQSQLLEAIEKERVTELFAEGGHRWLDLKRTNRVDGVMEALKTTWQSTDALWPIPETEVLNNSNLKQNPGY